MNSKPDIPVFPIAALTIGPVPALGLIIIRPDFLSHQGQKPEEATLGRSYALTPVQALDLIQRTQKALDHLSKTPSQVPPGQSKH